MSTIILESSEEVEMPIEKINIKTSNTESYRLYFPLELTNLDYIRRIIDFLQEGFTIICDFIKKLYPTIEKEEGDDSYHLLKWLIKTIDIWSQSISVDKNFIDISLNYLYSVRNSFAHQNDKVKHHTKGILKIASKKNVREFFKNGKNILSIFSERMGDDSIKFTEDNILFLEKQYEAHQKYKKERKNNIKVKEEEKLSTLGGIKIKTSDFSKFEIPKSDYVNGYFSWSHHNSLYNYLRNCNPNLFPKKEIILNTEIMVYKIISNKISEKLIEKNMTQDALVNILWHTYYTSYYSNVINQKIIETPQLQPYQNYFIKIILLKNKPIIFTEKKYLMLGVLPFVLANAYNSFIMILLFLACAGVPNLKLDKSDLEPYNILDFYNDYQNFKKDTNRKLIIVQSDLINRLIFYMRTLPKLLVNRDGSHEKLNDISWLDGDVQELGQQIWESIP